MAKLTKKDVVSQEKENSTKNNVKTLAQKDQEHKEAQEAKAIKTKLGRPPKINEPKATKKIVIYLTEEQIAKLGEKAGRDTASKFVKNLVLDFLDNKLDFLDNK